MLEIEKTIFEKTRCDFRQLKSYGFEKKGEGYLFVTTILNGEFRGEVLVDPEGAVSGKLYDIEWNEEYTNFRIAGGGAYAHAVRTAYEELLQDIRNRCFIALYYKKKQTNEIIDFIITEYQDFPEFKWIKFPSASVFRNGKNKEPYLYFIELGETGTEAIYLRLPEDRIRELTGQEGFYPSIFLSDKKWIMIHTDDVFSTEEIRKLIHEVYAYVDRKSFWLIPSNPKYYDIIGEFEKTDVTIWKQTGKVHVGDTVFLYLAAPFSSIMFQCEVIEADIPYTYQDENVKMKKVFRMRRIKKYEKGEISLETLREHGINWIRGQRRIPPELIDEIMKRNS